MNDSMGREQGVCVHVYFLVLFMEGKAKPHVTQYKVGALCGTNINHPLPANTGWRLFPNERTYVAGILTFTQV